MLELTVEEYLNSQVKKAGGEVRKLKWVGRRHGPDRFVALNGVTLVELKAPGKKPRPGQVREHNRLRKNGVRVEVIDSLEDVDELIVGLLLCQY